MSTGDSSPPAHPRFFLGPATKIARRCEWRLGATTLAPALQVQVSNLPINFQETASGRIPSQRRSKVFCIHTLNKKPSTNAGFFIRGERRDGSGLYFLEHGQAGLHLNDGVARRDCVECTFLDLFREEEQYPLLAAGCGLSPGVQVISDTLGIGERVSHGFLLSGIWTGEV